MIVIKSPIEGMETKQGKTIAMRAIPLDAMEKRYSLQNPRKPRIAGGQIMDNNEKRKNEIVSKLQIIYSYSKLKPHECEWILQVIDYIKEDK